MKRLTSNGFDFYKSKKYWTPTEAAGFVMGIEVDTVFYLSEDYVQISLVLDASIKAFDEKKLLAHTEIEERTSRNAKDFYQEYCDIFCRYDDVYEKYYLSCFEPLEYMKWIITEKIIKIPLMMGVTIENGLKWMIPPIYDKEIPKTYEIGGDVKLNEKCVLRYKALKYWTISEGFYLSQGHYPGSYAASSEYAEVIERGYRTGDIEAVLCEGECGETPCFSPFVLLDNWKKAGYNISSSFDFVKEISKSGEIKYSWTNSNAEKTRAKDTERLAKYYDPEIHDEEPIFGMLPNLEESQHKIFEAMKKLDLWTFNEGIALLTLPHYLDDPGFDYYIKDILFELDLKPYIRAVQAGNLKVIGFDNIKSSNWGDGYGALKVSPFKFLDFVKKKDLFRIPPGLEFVKRTDESGKIRYSWASDVREEASEQQEINNKVENKTLDPRAETTYLNIIGALLECVTGAFKDETFTSETELRNFIDEKFDDLKGVRARTLAEKFALAKKALNDEL